MHCTSVATALAAFLSLASNLALAAHFPRAMGRRHASVESAFSHRTRSKRQDFLSTTQPSNLADGSATADEGCTLWIQPWAGASCLSVITYSPGLILEDFLDLNTAVDSSCSNLETDYAYCIDTDDSHDASSSTNNAVAKVSSCGTKKKTAAATATATSKAPATTKSKTAAAATATKSSGTTIIGGLGGGLLEIDDPVCGPSDPTKQTTNSSGPNGKVSWLNCGISSSDKTSGWTYPNVTLDEIVYQNMSTDGIYSACSPYFKYFEQAAAKYNVPAIFFAAFAMQESSCDPNASGDEGGAWGLMQITTDKCGSAPDGNCNDPEYNVLTAASYYSQVLDSCGGNPLCATGQYNGWTKGMSYDSATADADSCCVCQNNLDYLHQFFNAWIQDISGSNYTPYNNLAICSDRTGNS